MSGSECSGHPRECKYDYFTYRLFCVVMFSMRTVRVITELGGVMLWNRKMLGPLSFQIRSGLQNAGNLWQHSTMLDIHMPCRRKQMFMPAWNFNGGVVVFISPDDQSQPAYKYADKQLWQSIYSTCFPCSLDRITNGFSLPRLNGFDQCINSFSLCSVCKAGSWING